VKLLDVNISADGKNTKIDAINFSGEQCATLLKKISDSLGNIAVTENKPEFYMPEISNIVQKE
jgi:hypothetical protein